MEEMSNSDQGRVRRNSSEEANREIDKKTLNNIRHYSNLSNIPSLAFFFSFASQ